jgi:hypothetical protein
MTTSIVDTYRARLDLTQPRTDREGALLEIAQANGSALPPLVPLLEDVLVNARALRIAIALGEDGPPLGSALAAARALQRGGATFEPWHVQELSAITRLPYSSTRNERDAALSLLQGAGLAPLAPPPKPKKLTSLDKVVDALRNDNVTDSTAFHASKVKAKDFAALPDDELFLLVQTQLARAQQAGSWTVQHWIGLAKQMLPSPSADRALYASLVEHSHATVRTRAKACIKIIDA